MFRFAMPLIAAVTLTACATTQTPQASSGPTSIEAIQAARMADLLTETASREPERIRAAQSEMAALQRALTAEAPTEPIAPAPMAPALPAAPNLDGARSVMSAVHLASYREYDNLRSGWSELQSEAAALRTLDARVSQVDLGERGIFLRLKAGPLDSPAAARALCAQLEAAGHWCMPADYTGEQLQPSLD